MCKIVIRNGQPYVQINININEINEAKKRENIKNILNDMAKKQKTDTTLKRY
jgi:uncharacterized protein (UPF0128 family)